MNTTAIDFAAVAHRAKTIGTVGVGSDYTDAEIEFMKALDHYKRHYHRPHPTCCEVFAVLQSLGYERKQD